MDGCLMHMILFAVFYSVRIWDSWTWEGPAELWDHGSVLQWRQPSQAWTTGGFLFLLIHTHHISHCSGGGERWRGKTHTGHLWECQLGLQIGLFEKSLWSTTNMYVSLWLLEKALQSLLESLTCPPYTPTQHLEREQALAKEFAEILHFTLRFDELKVRPCVLGQFNRFTLSTCMSRCFSGLWGGGKKTREVAPFPKRHVMW